MEFKKLMKETRAVSPVIGVVLMIAIAVILAAVVGTVVLAMGNEPVSTPQATFSFEYDEANDDVLITHEGGDSIAFDELNVDGAGDTWTAGQTITADVAGEDVFRIVWEDPNSDSTSVIASYEV